MRRKWFWVFLTVLKKRADKHNECHFYQKCLPIFLPKFLTLKMKKEMHPESLMMSHGYKPELSEGAVKPPIFLTSTFAFKTAEEGKAFFEVAYGLRKKEDTEELGLIYSRINNPNLEILENRLSLWDKADDSAVFESGMAAISTVLLEFLKPGDVLLYSNPTYGGTDHFINAFLNEIGVEYIGFYPWDKPADIEKQLVDSGKADKLKLVYIETPANPTNDLFDIEKWSALAKKFGAVTAVDNTYMGPVWSSPLDFGADLVIYSATKYLGGHSDLIAGAVSGSADLMVRVKTLRTFLGNMAGPHTGWMLIRSLETLKIRMEQQAKNARAVAEFLREHPKVDDLHYLGFLEPTSDYYEIFKRQYESGGAMLSFEVRGGEAQAFKFLNNLKLVKLAVSLGSTESLAQHPATMTHVAISEELKEKIGINDSLIRLSVGVENHEDLIADIANALEQV